MIAVAAARLPGDEPRPDRGSSLTELLVSMALLGMLSPIAVGFLASAQEQTRASVATSANLGDLRLALTSIERQVRSGNQPLTVSPTALALATCADPTVPADIGRVRVVEFRIDSGSLQSRSYRAGGTAGTWQTVISGMDATSGFAAAGTAGVRVTLTVAAGNGRRATGDTVVSPRNTALAMPLPQWCP